jgi:hypothetical protein
MDKSQILNYREELDINLWRVKHNRDIRPMAMASVLELERLLAAAQADIDKLRNGRRYRKIVRDSIGYFEKRVATMRKVPKTLRIRHGDEDFYRDCKRHLRRLRAELKR